MMRFLQSRLSQLTTLGVVGLTMAAVLYLGTQPREAAAKPPLGKQWAASQRISMNRIDHSAYDRLLKKHVDEDGYADYAAWKNSASDRRALQQYLVHLSRASRRKQASREARLAFWINAYNAVTIEGILREYPTDSIRNHTAKLVGYNIWEDLPLQVGGEAYSLKQIEHEILRTMDEPRIHFAIVCASVGCPRLLDEAYTAGKLEEQLSNNARDFFSRSKNLRLESSSGTLYLSSILDWFGEDFGQNRSQRMQYLFEYFPANVQEALKNGRIQEIAYLDYDWSLNDQRRKLRTDTSR